MFVDRATIVAKAGKGGDGALSFRKEKFVDRGGPDGGDGGDGGDIIFKGSLNQNTLANFRYQKELAAEPGQAGSKQKRHGRNGKDLSVDVPVGTVIGDQSSEILADITEDHQTVVVARGGKGGFGNAHFVSSTRQTPRVAEKGEPGEQRDLKLELKMTADVGLVGLPNAGKSTLLSVLSAARPAIADYPFTTLTPNLGVVDINNQTSLLFADIPGLIEGAAEGKGLGDEFLRHVERTAALLHLIDIYNDDVAQAYHTIQNELKAYSIDLSKRSQIVVLTKVEGLDSEMVEDALAQLKKVVGAKTPLLAISAKSKQGLPELLHSVQKIVEKQRAKKAKVTKSDVPDVPILRLEPSTQQWQVNRKGNRFTVSGPKIERFARRTDFTSPDAIERLRNIMKKMGILHELKRQGIELGQTVAVDPGQFEW